MKFGTHRSGAVSLTLWAEKGLVVAREGHRPGVESTVYIPVELLQHIQDDLWAYDSSKHNKRKDEAK